MSIIWWASVIWLSSLLLYSAMFKLVDYGDTPAAVARYRLVSARAARPIGFALPLAEAATAIMLLLTGSRAVGAIASACLSALFTVATAHVLLRRIDVSCGCVGRAARKRSSWIGLARATLMTVASAFVAIDPNYASIPPLVVSLVIVISALPMVYYMFAWRQVRRLRAPLVQTAAVS